MPRLRAILSAAFIGLAVGPLVLLGLVQGFQGFNAHRESSLAIERELAYRLAAQVKEFLDHHLVELSILDTVASLPGLPSEDRRALLARFLAQDSDLAEIGYVDARGIERERMHFRQVIPENFKRERSNDPLIAAALTDARPRLGTPRFETGTGEPYLPFVQPIVDRRSGRPVAVLAGEIRLKGLWDLFAEQTLRPGESIALLDGTGRLVAHPNPSLVLRGSQYALPIPNGIGRNLEGDLAMRAAKTLASGTLELIVVAERNLPAALKPAFLDMLIALVFLLAALAAAATLVRLADRRILAPIQSLATVASYIRAGHRSMRAEVREADEIGALAQAFNDMTDRSQRLIDDLQAEIESRQRAERARRASQNQLDAILDHSPALISLKDTEFRYIMVNRPFAEQTGLRAEELVGKTVFDILPGPQAERVASQDFLVLETGRPIDEEIEATLNGVTRSFLSVKFPIRDAQGAITAIGAITTDITVRKKYQAQLLYQANHDELTGLPNRSLALDRLAQAIALAKRHGSKTAVLFLDLDHFKNVNDTLGHSVGDALLKEAALRLPDSMRAIDTVARLGGDEFLIVLADLATPRQAETVARKLIERLAEPFLLEARELFVTASVGIALFPDDAQSAEDLLRHADAALYQAKRSGRNAHRFYTAALNETMAKRLDIETALRGALARNELSLSYQPLVAIENGRIVGAEALLRWTHPKLGSVSPVEFIPLAEENGLILPIGDWVMNEAARQMAAWRAAGHALDVMAINVSFRQFHNGLILASVEAALGTHGLPPQAVELEITERLLLEESSETKDILEALKRRGIRLVIDDFGTGYSSMSYLRRFPFDGLKIDREFVTDVATNADNTALVKAILSMAHDLGLAVVGEGVETDEQWATLKRFKCDYAQGYRFGKPMTAPEFERLLAASVTA
ncbi:MAG: EAL domain-containing protein [Rhodospirillales bacterium]|nr:EAL domain-containing protein [Rhodospirillales bacterium]